MCEAEAEHCNCEGEEGAATINNVIFRGSYERIPPFIFTFLARGLRLVDRFSTGSLAACRELPNTVGSVVWCAVLAHHAHSAWVVGEMRVMIN